MVDATAPRFSPGLSQAELQRGYQKVGSRPRIKRTDVKKAYQPYGLKIAKRRQNASDSRLFKEATKAVLAWHAKQAKAGAKAAQATSATGSSAGAGSVMPSYSSYQPTAPAYAVTQPATGTMARRRGSGGARPL